MLSTVYSYLLNSYVLASFQAHGTLLSSATLALPVVDVDIDPAPLVFEYLFLCSVRSRPSKQRPWEEDPEELWPYGPNGPKLRVNPDRGVDVRDAGCVVPEPVVRFSAFSSSRRTAATTPTG